MAYVTTEMTKAVRVALKEQMPGWKIRVAKNAYNSGIYMTIDAAPYDLKDEFDERHSEYGYMDINHYHVEDYKHADDYKKILDIMKEATASVGHPYYDHSGIQIDIQMDYFNTAYYYYLSIGSYEKPYIKKENNAI